MKALNEYLGVVSDLGRVDEGVVTMDVSAKRRKKIKALTSEILGSRRLQSGLASSIFGKARFMLSPCFGCLGKACLQPIMERHYAKGTSALNDEIEDSIEFIDLICDHLPPLELPLIPSELDNHPERARQGGDIFGRGGQAARRRRGTLGHLGAVVYHPVHGRRYCYAQPPPSSGWHCSIESSSERHTSASSSWRRLSRR